MSRKPKPTDTQVAPAAQPVPPDRDIAQASHLLRQIAAISLKIDAAKGKAQSTIYQARAEMASSCKSLLRRKSALEDQLAAITTHLAAERPFRSKHVPFGTLIVGQGKPRVAPVADTLSEEQIADNLAARGYNSCVWTKRGINREAIRALRLPASVLREIGLQLVPNPRPRYRLDREPLPELPDGMELRDND